MTRVTMPEPVAYQYENPFSKTLTLNWRKSPALGTFTPLFTEGQAEAYANQRVKQALEEAAEIADQHNDFSTYDAIRALIPKEPPCET